MKKLKYFVFLSVLILFITGCSLKKETITIDEFQKVTESSNYTFVDSTDSFAEVDGIQKVGIASNGSWQVEFYQLSSKAKAEDLFESNKQGFKEDVSNTSYEETTKGTNYKTYSLTTGTSYMYLSVVEDTLLYVRVPVEYRDQVRKFVDKTGY